MSDQTGTARIPRTEITGAFGSLLKLGMRRMLGGVPESAEVMWHHPGLFRDLMRFGRRSERWHELDRNLATLAAMAAAAEIGCGFCLDFHYFLAHDRGLDEAKARQVPRWREATVFSPLEREVMEYAVAMCQTRPAVTDELSASLLEQLGPAGLLELTMRVGLMNLTARGNVALGIRSEHYAEACGLRPLATPTAVASQP